MKAPTQTNKIYAGELERLQLSVGVADGDTELSLDHPMMVGEFCYHTFDKGLSIHSVNAIEQQDSHSAIELPPGLSFNFIFDGQVWFDFAQQKYSMGASQESGTCCVIVNDSQEIMGRQLTNGMKIKKLNIFAEFSWLESRCNSETHLAELNRLFEVKQVCQWPLSKKIGAQALRLISLKRATDLVESIHVEYLTMQLLSECMRDLHDLLESQRTEASSVSKDQPQSLKNAVNAALSQHQSVAEVATSLGMSERTLQRKFQKSYGSNISIYIKKRKMEKAKIALLIDKKTVGQAAYIAGYRHTSNFINAFKKHTGVTPAAFVSLNS